MDENHKFCGQKLIDLQPFFGEILLIVDRIWAENINKTYS